MGWAPVAELCKVMVSPIVVDCDYGCVMMEGGEPICKETGRLVIDPNPLETVTV